MKGRGSWERRRKGWEKKKKKKEKLGKKKEIQRDLQNESPILHCL